MKELGFRVIFQMMFVLVCLGGGVGEFPHLLSCDHAHDPEARPLELGFLMLKV